MYIPPILMICAICFCIMHLFTWISKKNKSNRLFAANGSTAESFRILLGLHTAGICFLGLVPLFLCKQNFFELVLGNSFPTLTGSISLVLLMLITIYGGYKAGRHIAIRQSGSFELSKNSFRLYFMLRAVFLVSYELFFRGILLFSVADLLGILPAVAISTGLTVFIHVFSNKRELWGCIPFGVLLSSFCITMHAI